MSSKHPFEYQRPTEEQVLAITAVREKCKELHETLNKYVHPSRELSLAITKLEECSMWANKGIVFN